MSSILIGNDDLFVSSKCVLPQVEHNDKPNHEDVFIGKRNGIKISWTKTIFDFFFLIFFVYVLYILLMLTRYTNTLHF